MKKLLNYFFIPLKSIFLKIFSNILNLLKSFFILVVTYIIKYIKNNFIFLFLVRIFLKLHNLYLSLIQSLYFIFIYFYLKMPTKVQIIFSSFVSRIVMIYTNIKLLIQQNFLLFLFIINIFFLCYLWYLYLINPNIINSSKMLNLIYLILVPYLSYFNLIIEPHLIKMFLLTIILFFTLFIFFYFKNIFSIFVLSFMAKQSYKSYFINANSLNNGSSVSLSKLTDTDVSNLFEHFILANKCDRDAIIYLKQQLMNQKFDSAHDCIIFLSKNLHDYQISLLEHKILILQSKLDQHIINVTQTPTTSDLIITYLKYAALIGVGMVLGYMGYRLWENWGSSSSSSSSSSVVVEQPQPVVVEQPQPVVVEQPQPVVEPVPQPVVVEQPQPVVVEQPQPVVEPVPQPVVVEQPQPVVVEQPQPVVVEQPQPVVEPVPQPVNADITNLRNDINVIKNDIQICQEDINSLAHLQNDNIIKMNHNTLLLKKIVVMERQNTKTMLMYDDFSTQSHIITNQNLDQINHAIGTLLVEQMRQLRGFKVLLAILGYEYFHLSDSEKALSEIWEKNKNAKRKFKNKECTLLPNLTDTEKNEILKSYKSNYAEETHNRINALKKEHDRRSKEERQEALKAAEAEAEAEAIAEIKAEAEAETDEAAEETSIIDD